MNSFIITNCIYDGSSGDPNPQCWIYGQVNGTRVFATAFFAYLMAANAANQMQAALTAVMFNWYAAVYGTQFTPWLTPIAVPVFPSVPPVSVTAQHTTGPYPQAEVVVTQALIGSWSA